MMIILCLRNEKTDLFSYYGCRYLTISLFDIISKKTSINFF